MPELSDAQQLALALFLYAFVVGWFARPLTVWMKQMPYSYAVCLILLLAVMLSGCATPFGERGHFSKQEQEKYLRTGK